MIRKNRVQIKNYERIYQQKLREQKKELNAKNGRRLSYKQGMDFTNVDTEDLTTEFSEKKSLKSDVVDGNENETNVNDESLANNTLQIPNSEH